jgi:hypothetical protein
MGGMFYQNVFNNIQDYKDGDLQGTSNSEINIYISELNKAGVRNM